ncbi:MAG: flagellar hook-basal body complex protein FliE [Lachnospiraceae bacterium]|nr:flagellar hook-basal body complex protein FliE [Lachnospiraceae bacterium]MBR1876689.1 flagellar hook-basal body complex protein FliE [Lachnospiraceae bacterium]
MDISSFYNLTSDAVKGAAKNASTVKYQDETNFNVFLDAAKNQINETNSYIHDEETEEIKLALGLTENTHDLAIAQAKASTAIQYTVALRDRFLEAYREIMQMQI